MKKIIILLSIFVVFFAKAQKDVLINNTWYLGKVVIDNVGYPTPNNSEISSISATFADAYFMTAVCNSLAGTISNYDDSNLTFTPHEVALTLMMCQNPVNDSYEDVYFEQFWFEALVGGPYNYLPISYSIVPENEVLKLTITNSQGDQAIYFSEAMAVSEIEKLNVEIYPNPATNVLNIETSLKIERINVYEVSGKLVKTVQNAEKTIDVSRLQNGVYHLEIFTDKGKIYKKIIIN
ncbi:MAG: T9SS type A sorting domain-containing protein [Flavobacteriaceae bacterium]|jgi:heat shock protein HslJ|nr:T9SS type A sorting domain-containing protein [Flavobacteriaceae bacterium]